MGDPAAPAPSRCHSRPPFHPSTGHLASFASRKVGTQLAATPVQPFLGGAGGPGPQ